MRIEELKRSDGARTMLFECPACGMGHQVHVAGTGVPVWGWNGRTDLPTFTPSILVTGVKPLNDGQHAAYVKTGVLPEPEPLLCHSFVTDGRIQFLSDCKHALAGQTVDLPEVKP